MYCKSLWIKASAKCINVNRNVENIEYGNPDLLMLELFVFLKLWNFETSKKKAECNGHLSWVHCVQFSTDGSLLLSSSDDQTIRVS